MKSRRVCMNTGKLKLGVVGNGFVGGAVVNGFRTKECEVLVYDKDKYRSENTLDEVLECDFVFVCLPTPMTSALGGPVDLSIITSFFEDVVNNNQFNPTYIIKSTVPVGTTENINRLHEDIKVVHNPEFLTAINSIKDFKNPDRTVVGGTKPIIDDVSFLYEEFFPEAPVIKMSSGESELVKYAANCFLATKVMYFNLIHKICESKDLDYNNVSEGVIADRRIGKSHYEVPGPDGDFGFGGTCFPKDINGLIEILYSCNVDSTILKEVWRMNKTLRENWDWADSPSAVSSIE